jgi:lipoprotein-anchoring transpeptidase ErfK/SrfK
MGRRGLIGLALLALAVVAPLLIVSSSGGRTLSSHHRHPAASADAHPLLLGGNVTGFKGFVGPNSVLVATADVPSLPVYANPGGATTASSHVANPNPLGAPLTLLVNVQQGAWLDVYLPVRPNETTGWVPLGDVTLAVDPIHISVSLSLRTLVLQDDGETVLTAPVAVGAPGSPTPTGHFFVTEVLHLTDPGDAYGPYALGLSGFSNTYYAFDGGPGQIAIHGTDQPWVIGGYASHGCVRLDNATMAQLAVKVPAGTPVDIAP